MKDTICRAITFINYNIPIRKGSNIWTGFAEYYTTGFFDRMYTKRVDCNYASKQLRGLWDYNIDCIAKGDGTYAHQNVYCFSKDEWNEGITDEEFWDYEKYAEMLLTFVIFVQTNGYVQEENGLEKRCKKFNDAVCEQLQDNGYVYTYVTVDKNDFVICIRSKKYKEAVNAIMKLHETDCEVVYSYSIFGISRNRQEQISEMEYKELNSQQIDSISLKGVTNSTKIPNEESYTLDAKYVGFCKQLVEKLYEDRTDEEEPDYKIYDILGDNDFRLIARMVPLGNLIKQFGAGGLLDYKGNVAQYTFYSTHLVLNTRDEKRQGELDTLKDNVICRQNGQLQEKCYRAELCQKMKSEMEGLNRSLRERKGRNPSHEKLITAFHGIYQLLQSLTALEAAPTKKYDFLSLYYPMKTLISILNKKIAKEMEELAENDNLYDFIHKISMVLHGTLRTDIQFFQIRDFNVTVHYAPAKLRAYYSIFVFMLSAHFSEVSSEENTHSYIFSPGMFKAIFVKQLFEQPSENERLMLITVPERYLYFPKNLSIILAHEVGHLIGDTIRKRSDRHTAILKCSYRVLCLEITKYVEPVLVGKIGRVATNVYAETLAFKNEDFLKVILEYDAREALTAGEQSLNYYSQKSLERIQKVYRAAEIDFGNRICTEYCCGLKNVYQNYIERMKKESQNLTQEAHDNFLFYDRLVGELTDFLRTFEFYMLPDVLKMFHSLMSETVSDMLAILVLGLTPMEFDTDGICKLLGG